MNVTLHRLGRNRRLDLRFEWLTLWPVCAVLPVRSHRRDMGFLELVTPAPRAAKVKILWGGWPPYSDPSPRRQETAAIAQRRAAQEGFRSRMGASSIFPYMSAS